MDCLKFHLLSISQNKFATISVIISLFIFISFAYLTYFIFTNILVGSVDHPNKIHISFEYNAKLFFLNYPLILILSQLSSLACSIASWSQKEKMRYLAIGLLFVSSLFLFLFYFFGLSFSFYTSDLYW